MTGIIDFHSHILPGVDDGSETVQESIAMLQMEAAQGVQHVIATPHFYAWHESPEVFLEKRQQAEGELRKAMADREDLPRLTMGAEVSFFRGISEWEVLEQLTIPEKNCILIEMPPAPWPEAWFRELEQIFCKRGITPIIAHIDRYISPFRTYRIPERLAKLPVLVQANAEFLLSRRTRWLALRLFRRNQIHLLGSDCHDLTSRPPNLGTAVAVLERHLGEQNCMQLHFWQESILPYDS